MQLAKCYLLCCLTTVWIVAATAHVAAQGQSAFQKMSQYPQEHWYNVTLMGTKIGYMHTYRENAVYQGEAVKRNKVDMVMSLKGLGTNLTIETTRLEYTGANLMPRYFLSTSNEDGSKQVEGRIVDGIAYIKVTLNGETTESETSVPPGTVSEFMSIDALLSQKPIRIGDKQTVHSFIFDLLKPVKTELEVIAEETLTYQGAEKQVYVLKQTTDMMGGITAQVWVDSDGVTYRTEVPLMGLSMAMTKTDRGTALGDIGEVDIVLRTRILPGGKRPTPKAERLVAEVRMTEGSISNAVMSTAMQQLEVTSEQTGKLSIQISTVDAESCPDLPIQDEESAFLGSSAYIQTGHPEILAKALEILAGETNSWRAAKQLNQWVYTAITDKELSGGYNSSLTTLGSRSGDCTEHTVLFIALARSVGIPARICSGIIFSQDAFYYHFWPEVYVGRWVQTDPTLGQTLADANHIQLGGSTVESDTLLEFAEGVFRTLNQLEIVVIE
ncbi:hypothetical protein C6495_04030 [Candidatus Poribacteria bacterium]|nr:MAG: hypothetical protein C6495_04030 [Candidatus Poribacteria bacterium]